MEIINLIFITTLGAIIGSFAACMGYRIPNKIGLSKPNSHCPKCKKEIKWYMNIPIFSYIFLKGKCYYCKEKIGILNLIIELTSAILFAIFYLKFNINAYFFLGIILSTMLSVTIISDFYYYYISDRVLLISYILTLIVLYIYDLNIVSHIIGSIILFLIMYGFKIFGNIAFKKESLGDGDIKLMAVIGLTLGTYGSLISLFIGSIIALVYAMFVSLKKEEKMIPFGPFLIIGAIICIYYNELILSFITF